MTDCTIRRNRRWISHRVRYVQIRRRRLRQVTSGCPQNITKSHLPTIIIIQIAIKIPTSPIRLHNTVTVPEL